MKLRNKKTGEIGEIGYIGSSSGELTVSPINRVACESIASYNSLAELNEEWEDYEDTRYYFIDYDSVIIYAGENEKFKEEMKEIGNYFKTKEEAEKAVAKLKAWKRLKDNGFRFEGWEMDGTIWFETKQDEQEWSPKYRDDLDLLFGGEND